ncbi:hypothetical protein Vse01_32170 [Micromonospora sediminimaris]|uniref:Uncharacterized protein n=1 Tax=Micromonospora sediminimaris TaxID=547162 RepID=A0A9W5XKL5_9ACTN|nr:hypothetical protein Vse01_32170 [Micromonospora sediminimaris]
MTAAEVQLSAVPLPTVRVGFDVSTACPAAGTVTRPVGLPVPRPPRDAPVGLGLGLLVGLLPKPVWAAGVACAPGACPALGVADVPLAGACAPRGSALGTDGLHAARLAMATPNATAAIEDLRRTP